MSVWDDPQSRPPSAWPQDGETIEATITRLDFGPGKYGPTMQVELDRDGRTRFAPTSLWRTMYQLRPEPGDRVRISRLARDQWRVERVLSSFSSENAEPAAAQPPGTSATGPSW